MGKTFLYYNVHNILQRLMLVVNDAMVLIHLAKISLLDKSCEYFRQVVIPQLIFEETVKAGKEKGFGDALLIESTINKGIIKVKKIKKKSLVRKANDLNIFRGEAEAVALCWQEQADLLATDDDNVRNKKELIGVNLVGTPAIILTLYKNKKIGSEKVKQSINRLRKIGWFSNEVLDKIFMEVEKHE